MFIFSSCTTKYSSPYSARNVADDLSEKYSTEIEVVETRKAGFFEGNKSNKYVLKDKKRGFLFEAGSYVKMDRHIPLYAKNRWDDYCLGLMRHYHDDVLQLADKYKIRLVPPLLKKSEYSYVRDDDSVFIHSSEELYKVADLYIELSHLYNFTYEGSLPAGFPELIVNYALPEKPDSVVDICRLSYLESKSESNPPAFNRRITTKYINYIPEKHVVYNNLYKSWNVAVEKGLIFEEKAQYKQYESQVFGLIAYNEEIEGYSTATDVSGMPVSIYYQLTDTEQLPKNISISEVAIANSLYNNYLHNAFSIIDEEFEEMLRSNGEGFAGQLNLTRDNLTEQLPLSSVIIRSDGAMIVCYKISFVSDLRLLIIVTDIDGKHKGAGILSTPSFALFKDFEGDFKTEDFKSVYIVFGL